MKTNPDLERAVHRELAWEPALDESNLSVRIDDGIVTLRGHVHSHWEKDVAVAAAQRVAGVRGVADDIRVELPAGSKRTDTELALAVANALEWNAAVPPHAVGVRVQDGWVTLTGEVDWQFQRMAASHAVRQLVGVKGVLDDIVITPRARAADVKAQIEAALQRHAEHDARAVRVETRDGEVVLHGVATSLPERDQIERAAWSAPGVSNVRNEITVAVR